jgi:hypothetical protein
MLKTDRFASRYFWVIRKFLILVEMILNCWEDRRFRLTAVGLWTLHFDWGPKGNYIWTPLYFNFDGTFAYLAGDNEGTWTEVDDKIIWRFKRQTNTENNSIYSGCVARKFMSGIMFSFEGEKGHWYAIKKGTKVFALKETAKLPYLIEKEGKLKLDPAGKKTH